MGGLKNISSGRQSETRSTNYSSLNSPNAWILFCTPYRMVIHSSNWTSAYITLILGRFKYKRKNIGNQSISLDQKRINGINSTRLSFIGRQHWYKMVSFLLKLSMELQMLSFTAQNLMTNQLSYTMYSLVGLKKDMNIDQILWKFMILHLFSIGWVSTTILWMV